VPIGLVLLPVGLLLVKPLAAPFRPLASSLLAADAEPVTVRAVTTPRVDATTRPTEVRPHRAFQIHAGFDAVVILSLIVIWALSSGGYFWPIWVALPLGVALAIHGWFVLLRERPSLLERFRESGTLAAAIGIAAAIACYFIGVWALAGAGYFWPVWPMLGMGIVIGIVAVVVGPSTDRAQMAERIETLESTRAGAVDLQESELRRIERDLHDGAQARLVALGMSLGMVEQKLAEDPERVAELLAEARAGAESALQELRDLARGIHPPVLADRGLEAALRSLASASPMRVGVHVDLAERPAPAVETAAYFVAAEALANATKHSYADRVEIRVTDSGGALELEVEDDGRGGADPNGTGLLGMRRRVQALDGTLTVTSPKGGPTTIHAQLPCAS
jgi:signal transduction histidine kinase